eukprot:CAMPEP_0175884030 /NCGR_PEP_ID=MMETSP0107_2-20121207/44303_1 /TAXON_ID=195067 ORGANISM="Goniomonas pacifica, Strain CCMP1869" /NCGR_SAMPLE_ID=MMETSP0107_2 /ASSEMBLY_ACC=CAM_ASM_000203 /LENGTH=55 /DNA_ID=CAMNT_0017204153 /DNA_START=66 /DNA_END=233 /DNA_ORIENTATION=+
MSHVLWAPQQPPQVWGDECASQAGLTQVRHGWERTNSDSNAAMSGNGMGTDEAEE